MFKEILKTIEAYNRILVHGHIRPDGDCYGSQFGLAEIIKENYPEKDVHVVGDTSDFVSFLGTPEKATITDEMYKGALAIVVDCGSADRVSDQRYQTADKVIKIDHHIAQVHYGDIVYVEEESPACCQIITKFAKEMGLKINEKAAFALYTGLVTDTGRFRIRGVDSDTVDAASELMKHNVDVEVLDNKLRKKVEKLIFDTFDALDKTGENTNHYREMFAKMNNNEFLKFIFIINNVTGKGRFYTFKF